MGRGRILLFLAAMWVGAALCARAESPDDALFSAAASGDLEKARQALGQGASLTATRYRDLTPFQLACRSGNLKLVQYLYAQGANPNLDGVELRPGIGWYGSPLTAAAGEGHLDVVRFLVESCGIDPDKRERPQFESGRTGWTALALAAENGKTNVVRYLLSRGAAVDSRDDQDRTPLFCAAAQGHLDTAVLLLEKRADPNAEEAGGLTPLHAAASRGASELVGRLLVAGADPNRATHLGSTPLHFAAASGDGLTCGVLLSWGADARARNRALATPLHLAAGVGSEAACTALLIAGAEVNVRDTLGETPLHRAARRGLKGAVTLLLDAGAAPGARAFNGDTPLHAAAEAGSSTAAAILLYRGAERDARNDLGQTALHLACLEGRSYVAHLLVVLGAYADAADDQGWTPLHFAAFADSPPTVKTLLEDGRARLEPRNAPGQTPLLVACGAASKEVVQALLDAGAYVGARDKEGVGSLGQAWLSHHSAVSALLMARGAQFGGGDFTAGRKPSLDLLPEDEETLSALLASGLDPDLEDPVGQRPLHRYCREGRADMVRLLLQYGADAEARDRWGGTPLHAWAQSYLFSPEIPALLLKAGAKVDGRDKEGQSPLMRCPLERDALEKTRILLDADADGDLVDDDGLTPLHYATYGDRPGCVDLLLSRKVSTKAVTSWGASALALAVGAEEKNLTERLRAAGASEAGVREAELDLASGAEDFEQMRRLLKEGADPDGRVGINGRPIVWSAVGADSWDGVRLLLDAGASADAADRDGCTVLLTLCEEGDVEALEHWLAFRPDVNLADRDGQTPLHAAVLLGSEPSVALLLQHGADPNRADAEGRTPLFDAPPPSDGSPATGGARSILDLLLQAGASPTVKDLKGRTCLHEAALCGWDAGRFRALASRLLDAGADLEARDAEGRTPLHLAAAAGLGDAVQVLLELGASPTALDREGLTPSGLALKSLRKNTFDLLRKWGRRRPPEVPGT